jgi:hypothetical protein
MPVSAEWMMRTEERLDQHDEALDEHGRRLATGDIGFAELRKDVSALTEKVGELIGVLKWCAGGIVGFVAAKAAVTLLWNP